MPGPSAALPAGALVLTPGNVFTLESGARLRAASADAAAQLASGESIPIASFFGRSPYHAAQDTRFREFTGDFFNAQPKPEHEMLSPGDRAKIISRGRVMFRNNPYLNATLRAYVQEIGTPTLKAETEDAAFNDAKETHFEQWALNCESENGLTLDQVVEIKNFEVALAGGMFAVAQRTGRLQLIAYELCGSEKSGRSTVPAGDRFASGEPIPAGSRELDGIVRDPAGDIIGYRFGQRDSDRWDSVSFKPEKSSVVEARYVWHFFDPDRVEMGRGVPKLAPVLTRFQDLFDTAHARDQQVKNAACLSMWVTKNIDPAGFAESMRGALTRGEIATAASLKEQVATRSQYQQMRQGAIYYGAVGEDLRLIEPKLTSGDWHEHYIDVAQVCCACLDGLPVEIALEGFRASNYSSARATVNKWKRNVARLRRFDERLFLDELQAWVANRASFFDELKAVPPAVQQLVSWGWPAIPDIDGAKTSAQNALDLANGTTTRTRIYADKGLHRDLEDKTYARERIALFQELVAAAKKSGLTPEQAAAFALAQMPKVADPATLTPLATAVVSEPAAPAQPAAE